MAYISVNNIEEYENTIYSGEAQYKLKVLFNGEEYEDIEETLESLEIFSRILPSEKNAFSLNNFISKEATIIVHDLDQSLVENQVEISLGTYIESLNDYEYVPLGIFNIQDKPETYNGKQTIKLRDNAVKFDFVYDASKLIEESEIYIDNIQVVTKMQILQDICSIAGVECNVEEFLGMNDYISIYDNSITARLYVAYLAEQSGNIATIDRNGNLIFVSINNLETKVLPYELLESYEAGIEYKISKVIYQSGTIYFESEEEENEEYHNTLFLDGSNPYITSQNQVDSIFNIVNNFTINSLITGKILGNPLIDAYDIIEFYDDELDKTFRTLANNYFKYNGNIIQQFDNQIEMSEAENNTTIINNETFKKNIKQTIDNVENSLNIVVSEIDETINSVTTLTQTAIDLTISIQNNRLEVEEEINSINSNIETMQGTINQMNFSFQTDGLKIGSSGTDINSTLDNAGLKIYNLSTLIAIFNQRGSGIGKLIVTDSIQYQNMLIKKRTINSKYHGNNKEVISMFWNNNLIETLEDLEGN